MVLSASCAHMRVMKAFELKQTTFEVVECNYAHLRVFKSFESKETRFEVVWVQLYTFEGIKVENIPMWVYWKGQRHIWGLEGLIWVYWVCKGTFEWRKLVWSGLRVEWHILVEKNLIWIVDNLSWVYWERKYTFEFKSICFEWFEGVIAHWLNNNNNNNNMIKCIGNIKSHFNWKKLGLSGMRVKCTLQL